MFTRRAGVRHNRGRFPETQGEAAPIVFPTVTSANLVARWKAHPDNVTIATGVSTLVDLGPNGYNAVNATGTEQPTLDASTLNGKYSVKFDGVDDKLSLDPGFAALFSGNDVPITIFAACRIDHTAALFGILLGLGSASAFINAQMFNGAARLNKKGDADAAVVVAGTPVSTATPYVMRYVQAGTTASIYANGSVLAGANGAAQDRAVANFTSCYIGAVQAGAVLNSTCPVYIGEMIVYDGVLSGADAAAVEAWLTAEYL